MKKCRVSIRREVRDDHDRVRGIVQRAFGQPDEARIVDALRGRVTPEISLVATLETHGGGQAVGHIYFSPVEVGPERRGAVGLGPVSVDPDFQGDGIGSALCRRGLEVCREIGQPLVFVLGHPEYYPRFGFVPARPLGLFYKSAAFDRAFFAAELNEGAAHGFSGEVVYEPAFGG